jgi:hypothetical protein
MWEAADMGLLLWRRNLGYLIPFFAVPFWICAFGLLLLSNSELTGLLPGMSGGFSLFYAWFALWWLNPLFDRLVLHVAARRYFEPGLSFHGLLQGLGGSLGRGLPGDLLWRRFSPWRAAVLPLRILERGSGREGRNPPPIAGRKRALSGGGLHFCILLSVWCPLLQWVLLAGEFCFAYMMSGLFWNSSWSLFSFLEGKGIYCYTLWCVNYLVVESLYVCMGFGLYLNSRVEVEGWDLELLFRKFIARRGKAGALVLLLLGLALPYPAGLFGQSRLDQSPAGAGVPALAALPPDLGADRPAEILEEILSRDLGGEKKTWGIRFKEDEDNSVREILRFPFPWLDFSRNAGALLLRGALILAFAVLALACGILVYRRRTGPSPSVPAPDVPALRKAPVPPPSPESLLEDADRSHRRGLIREAWSLCYQASLEALSRYHRIPFPAGATEYRCLALVRRCQGGKPEGPERAFADLIRHWVALAYGGISPPDGVFEVALAWALSLCRGEHG